MIGIFVRELRALSRNLKAIAGITLFTLIGGVLFQAYCLGGGSGNLSAFAASMALVAAIAVPLISADSFMRDRKAGQYKLYSSLPVTDTEVFFGKLFANLIFSLAPVFIMAFYPLVLAMFKSTETVRSYLSLLVLALLVIFVMSLSLMLSALVKKAWIYYLSVYGILVLLFGVGLASSFMPETLGGILDTLLVFRRFSSLSSGFFDIPFAVLLASVSLLFLLLAYGMNKKEFPKTADRITKGGELAIRICSAVLCVVLNFGLVILPMLSVIPAKTLNIDITAQDKFAIDSKTKDYLASLKEDVEIYALTSGGEDEVTYYTERYASCSKKLKFKKLSVITDGAVIEKLGISDSNVSVGNILLKTAKRDILLSGSSLYYYTSSSGSLSATEYIQYVTFCQEILGSSYASQSDLQQAQSTLQTLASYKQMFNAEERLNNAVAYVTAEYVPTVYFSTGNGEKNVGKKTLDFTSITEIPKDASEIVINSPDKDFTSGAVELLKKFAERGGRLLVLTNGKLEKMENLSKFLFDTYGLTAGKFYDTEIEADFNESLAANYGETATLKGACTIEITEREGISVVPVLSRVEKQKDEEGKDVTVSYAVSVHVKRDGKDSLRWLSGADTYNSEVEKPAETATLAEQKEYTNLQALLSLYGASLSALLEEFKSGLFTPSAKLSMTSAIEPDTTLVILFDVIFIGVIPVSIAGSCLIFKYARKRKSNM